MPKLKHILKKTSWSNVFHINKTGAGKGWASVCHTGKLLRWLLEEKLPPHPQTSGLLLSHLLTDSAGVTAFQGILTNLQDGRLCVPWEGTQRCVVPLIGSNTGFLLPDADSNTRGRCWAKTSYLQSVSFQENSLDFGLKKTDFLTLFLTEVPFSCDSCDRYNHKMMKCVSWIMRITHMR